MNMAPSIPFQTQESEFRLSNGKRLLNRLFFETSPADKTGVKYTLKEKDHLGYPSLHRLYLETNDPTEYTFATKYFESWSHWELLCECTWFKPYLEAWRRELEIRMKSEALANILKESKKPGPSQFQASKYVLEKGWEPKSNQPKRGRPSKEDIREEAYKIANTTSQINDDYERILGSKVN